MKTTTVRALFLGAILAWSSAAGAAQLAPNYVPPQQYACNGQQHDIGFALDYGQSVYIRDVDMGIIGALPGQSGTVTFSIAVPPGAIPPFITGLFGAETHTSKSYGVNGFFVPAAQALAVEFSCTGGGSRTLIMTIGYTTSAGPNP